MYIQVTWESCSNTDSDSLDVDSTWDHAFLLQGDAEAANPQTLRRGGGYIESSGIVRLCPINHMGAQLEYWANLNPSLTIQWKNWFCSAPPHTHLIWTKWGALPLPRRLDSDGIFCPFSPLQRRKAIFGVPQNFCCCCFVLLYFVCFLRPYLWEQF